jgi:hypothetical protein
MYFNKNASAPIKKQAGKIQISSVNTANGARPRL